MSASSTPWIALAGVVVGFTLAEGSRYIRYRIEISQYKRLVKAELKTILAQLPQKCDILNQAIEHMKHERFMPTLSVRSVTVGYTSILKKLYPHLKPIERNCLHIIFERLRVADEQMDNFEDAFIRAVKESIHADPWSKFIGRAEELLASYSVVTELASTYLDGKPEDVFLIEN